MIVHTILVLFIIILIVSRIFLKDKKYYNKLNYISLALQNLLSILFYALYYYFSYQEYVLIEAHAPISIIPQNILLVIGIAILNIVYNLIFILFQLRKS